MASFSDWVNWIEVSRQQVLSEDFIKVWEHKVHWANVSGYQTLSYDFILEHVDQLHLSNVLNNHRIKLDENQRAVLEVYNAMKVAL